MEYVWKSIVSRYISKSYSTTKNTIDRQYTRAGAAVVSTITGIREQDAHTRSAHLGVVVSRLCEDFFVSDMCVAMLLIVSEAIVDLA